MNVFLVDRLVKYTGFGNAAGLLAQYGFLAGKQIQKRDRDYSEDSDSETEEYQQLKDKYICNVYNNNTT